MKETELQCLLLIKWRPGDQCRATFSEDGLVYDAEILSVDQQTGTCVVRYRGYGNEEEQILDNLKPAPGRRPRQQRLSDMEVWKKHGLFNFHTVLSVN